MYCSDIVAYACMIVESHCHCQYTPSNSNGIGAMTHLLTCGHVGTIIILWQHCRGPQDRATLIERLRSGAQLTAHYRQHLWRHINLKSKHYTGFCDELWLARYKTDVFLVTYTYTHINIHTDRTKCLTLLRIRTQGNKSHVQGLVW